MTSRWFGDYEIVRQLRVGGMATLYLARRHGAAGFSRLVALKMIHPNLVAQPGLIDMFVDEARICSQISHPNVVHVEEFGVLDGTHYLVMEYVDGCSLNELLQVFDRQRRTLEPELAAGIIAQIAGGLHSAHETRDQDGQPLDIIHRDISQSNLLLSSAGNAKLIDFGIAKARNRMTETQALMLKGKYKYMAPEQATGAVVDRRCDVFSLGVVFWELLVGRPLFGEDSPAALARRLHNTEAPPPSSVNPDVPVVLDPIVLAMLRHDPAQRPQTAAEVQRRLMQALPGAANREPCELGALAIEVRDQRAAWREARRAAGEPSETSNHISFSPTPRSQRTAILAGEPEDRTRHSAPQIVATSARRWLARDRRAVLLGLAIVAVLGMIGGVLLRQRAVPAAAVTGPANHAIDAVVGAKPIAPSAPALPGAAVGTPTIAPPAPTRPASDATADPAGPAATRARPAALDASPPNHAPPDGQRSAAKPSAASKTATARGRPPPRSLAATAAGGAAPAARGAASPAGRGPAILRTFDPDGDGASSAESEAVKTRPPIATGFDDRTSETQP